MKYQLLDERKPNLGVIQWYIIFIQFGFKIDL